MDIQPTIIGPDLSINPEVVLNLFGGSGFPAPGIPINTPDLWLMMGENSEVGLTLKYCRNLQLQGKTGSNKASVNSKFEDSFYHVWGSFGGLMGDFFIAPIEGGYNLRGRSGHTIFNTRVNFVGRLPKITGDINGKAIDLSGFNLTETVVVIRGTIGGKKVDVQVNFGVEEVIQVRGQNTDVFMDYSVKSLGDKIVMEGITRNDFSKLTFNLLDENEFHVTGKASKVPVDYRLTLYDNGVAVAGNTGFYQADYAFVTFDESAKKAAEEEDE